MAAEKLSITGLDLYYGAAQALKGVSLDAEVGQVTSILGRNGVGKTSMLRAVSGRQGIRSGQILWKGKDISKLRPDARAQLAGAQLAQCLLPGLLHLPSRERAGVADLAQRQCAAQRGGTSLFSQLRQAIFSATSRGRSATSS